MSVSNLQQLFEHKLLDLHSAETQIIAALPKMIEAASHEQLRQALTDHLRITKEQLQRLNTINEEVHFKKKEVICEGMKGILKEGEKELQEINDNATRDAAIIAAAQSVEHYEIAGYGTAEEYARQLEMPAVAEMLQETLEEEKQTDSSLNALAKGGMFNEGLNEAADT